MPDERWRRVQELFDAAVDVPQDERDGFLTTACGGDDHLRSEVESLLRADRRPDPRLERAAGAEASPAGKRVGPYVLLRRLGEGGASTVYLAARADQAFDQEVALKLLQPKGDPEGLLRRFQQERRILAGLNHPNIAALFDGGSTDDDVPYFVMEYVDGERIDHYCDRHRLPVRRRLELFLQVTEAIAYAHRRLVVHRDIKPSNILVTEEGRPKLLDFGIAKVLRTLDPTTASLPRALTPGYASPEQVRGEEITTATDVYSLGVVLYKLLTGHLPPAPTPEGSPEAPLRPSQAVLRDEGSRSSAGRSGVEWLSRLRGSRPSKLSRELAGDLDSIVLLALRREPAERYGSVEQLSEDIRRHLDGRPVAAREPTLLYRAGRLARRHRTATALVVVALLSLGAAVGQILRERDAARAERDRAEQVAGLLVGLFDGAASGDVSARELLQQGVERIAWQLELKPGLKASVFTRLGVAHRKLGLYDEASRLLESALQTRREILGTDDPEIADTLHELAVLVALRGDFERSEAMQREALALSRRHPGADGRKIVAGLYHLGWLLELRGEMDGAEASYSEGLEICRRDLAADHPLVADGIHRLAVLEHERGSLTVAEGLYREAVARDRRAGANRDDAAIALKDLALLLVQKGELDEAEGLLREALEIEYKVFGREHPNLGGTLLRLARLLQKKGDLAAAETHILDALAMRRKALGDNHPRVGVALANLAELYGEQGRHGEAEPLLRESVRIAETSFPDGSPQTAYPLLALGRMLLARGEPARAEPELRRAVELRRTHLPPGSPLTAEAEIALARCRIDLESYAEAERLLLAAHAAALAAGEDGAGTVEQAAFELARLYHAWDRPEEARAYERAAEPG